VPQVVSLHLQQEEEEEGSVTSATSLRTQVAASVMQTVTALPKVSMHHQRNLTMGLGLEHSCDLREREALVSTWLTRPGWPMPCSLHHHEMRRIIMKCAD
jgi:hypothetical protein